METQRNFAILLSTLMLAIGVPMYIAAAQTDRELTLELPPGEVWERGDGLGYNMSLNLGRNGKYVARWTGCFGEYGRSEGTWSEVDGGIDLRASHEEGMIMGHLKHLKRVVLSGEMRLIPPDDIDEATDVGEPFSSFYAFKLSRLVEDATASDKTMKPTR